MRELGAYFARLLWHTLRHHRGRVGRYRWRWELSGRLQSRVVCRYCGETLSGWS